MLAFLVSVLIINLIILYLSILSIFVLLELLLQGFDCCRSQNIIPLHSIFCSLLSVFILTSSGISKVNLPNHSQYSLLSISFSTEFFSNILCPCTLLLKTPFLPAYLLFPEKTAQSSFITKSHFIFCIQVFFFIDNSFIFLINLYFHFLFICLIISFSNLSLRKKKCLD